MNRTPAATEVAPVEVAIAAISAAEAAAADALEHVEGEQPYPIIADIGMAQEDGHESVRNCVLSKRKLPQAYFGDCTDSLSNGR